MKILCKHSDPYKSGIYCIKNTTNNKTYVGSSSNIYYRLKRHLSDLYKNRHGNKHLQNSFNKYGKESFEAFILEYCDIKILESRERYYVNQLKSEYNKRIIDRKGAVNSIETRNKISETLKRRHLLGEIIPYKQQHNWKKIKKYTIDGNFIKEYDCIMDAVRENKVLKQEIIACLKKVKIFECHGFVYNYSEEPFVKRYSKQKRRVRVIDTHNNIITICESIASVIRMFRIGEKPIYRIINKNINYKGYIIEDVN